MKTVKIQILSIILALFLCTPFISQSGIQPHELEGVWISLDTILLEDPPVWRIDTISLEISDIASDTGFFTEKIKTKNHPINIRHGKIIFHDPVEDTLIISLDYSEPEHTDQTRIPCWESPLGIFINGKLYYTTIEINGILYFPLDT